MLDTDTIEQLKKPLDPEKVKTRKGRGGSGDVPYLEGHTVIEQANRIFGYGAWGVDRIGDPTIQRLGDRTLYAFTVKVTVHGVTAYTDTGVGISANDTPDAHETAIKGAVTDGLKRALRHFGAQFANDLYDRDRRQPTARPQQQPRPAQAAPAPAAAAKKPEEAGDARLGLWLANKRQIRSKDHPHYAIVDAWLSENYDTSITGFRTADLELRERIMVDVNRPETAEWLDGKPVAP